MIVDENGAPIDDCLLVLTGLGRNEKGITNRNGICVFKNAFSGEYKISAKKIGYQKLNSAAFDFIEKCDVFCFKVISGNEIFTEVEALYDSKKYEQGFELLEEIECDKKSELYAAVCFYKGYGLARCDKIEDAINELKKLNSTDTKFADQYYSSIEKIIQMKKSKKSETGEEI